MSFSSWLSRRLFSILDSDRVFEEMDRMKLEEKMLESQESEDRITLSSKRILSSFVVAVGGITVAKSYQVETWKLASAGAGIGLLTGITMTIYLWCQKRARCIRKVIVQLERTKTALRKRRQVFFSVSMRIPRSRHPLILRSCRIAVSLIECLVEKTIPLNSGSTWQDLYTDEINEIVKRSSEHPEILRIEETEREEDVDFEAIFEILIAVFKLHASEYSRVVIIDFLEFVCFRNFRRFLETCGVLQSFLHSLETIERLALKSEREKSSKNTEKQKGERKIQMDMTIEWRQQTVMALEAILESLESENVQRSQVELALHKTLVIVGSEKINNPKTENSGILQTTPEDNLEVIMIEKGKGERTDVDMVFEGVPLSDADKLAASKSTVARDVLLDGSEGRRHQASLFGELQLVLEPRRTNFEKRERAALAKFYGVDENQLEKMEEKKEEETFEGVGAGGDEDPEPYDWRKDAETSAGIHQGADYDDFLKALKLRRVEDDIIE
ncbi:Protein CBG05380 [Caenorhabditis briggsae]|uniref:Protein CBG05380 n=1 Tax=Caenorhabditis briggsae TaxID=6238 RepID=A8WZQ9_CAEBR|nr:Protein CBG05380 [Caenorhabditis briggsae]CAP25869.2 Protein CBG05380 [Caenorhabditis briggsae]